MQRKKVASSGFEVYSMGFEEGIAEIHYYIFLFSALKIQPRFRFPFVQSTCMIINALFAPSSSDGS